MYFFVLSPNYFARIVLLLFTSITSCAVLMLTARREASFASGRICYGKPVRLSVCLCVRLSVTLRYCVKTRERRLMRFSPTGSPVSLVFRC